MPSNDNERGGAVDVQIVFGREEAAILYGGPVLLLLLLTMLM